MRHISAPLRLVTLTAVFLCAFGWFVRPVRAALYWSHNVRGGEVTVCFAGDAVVVRPDRVREIVEDIQQFEYAANVRFLTVSRTRARDEIRPGGDLKRLACPVPTVVNRKDYHEGDIRVALWHTSVIVDPPGTIPGMGCTGSRVAGSFSNAPDDLETNRPCQYNLKLGDDSRDGRTGRLNSSPWLNHTLHEFGHALGLSHEHARKDENANCVAKTHGEYHATDIGYMTPYDKDSVMHYQFLPGDTPMCTQIGSNYSDNGLTLYDQLGLRILYPEATRVADIVGTTVIRRSESLRMWSAWEAQGANLPFVASQFQWRIDDVLVSGASALKVTPSTGNHRLEFSFKDFLGRRYVYTGGVRVLDPAKYTGQIVGPTSALSALWSSAS